MKRDVSSTLSCKCTASLNKSSKCWPNKFLIIWNKHKQYVRLNIFLKWWYPAKLPQALKTEFCYCIDRSFVSSANPNGLSPGFVAFNLQSLDLADLEGLPRSFIAFILRIKSLRPCRAPPTLVLFILFRFVE